MTFRNRTDYRISRDASAPAAPAGSRAGGARLRRTQLGVPRRVGPLDGIRALAILAVVFYHLRPSLLPGGFIGVTVFFVLSGFLITSSIDKELARTGDFSFRNYYRRRFIRLWPPVLVTIFATALATYIFAPSLFLKVQSDALSSALFVSNWTYIFREVSYFEAAGLPSPLTHMWYLGVLAQFYVLWPLVLVFLRKALKDRQRIMAVTVGLILASGLIMAVECAASEEISRAYYGFDARLGELLVGALAALYYRMPRRKIDIVSSRLAARLPNGILPIGYSREFAAYGVVILAIVLFLARGQSLAMYFGGFLFVAIASAFLILGVHHPASGVAKVLELRPFVYIGSRSYSLYLVHYPLLLLMNPATRTIDPSVWMQLLQVVVAILITEIFYQCVEKPTGWLLDHTPQRSSQAKSGVLKTTCVSLTGLSVMATVVLTWVPVNWESVAHARAVHLRPELANSQNTETQAPPVPQTPPSVQADPKNPDASTPRSREVVPVALKVPDNLDTKGWIFNPQTQTCNANAIIIGDSVTMGAADNLRAVLPNAYVDGQGNRKLPEGLAAYGAAKKSGFQERVTIISLGTNSLGNEEPVIKELIDAMEGRPIYFVTLRSPYDNAAENNEIIRRLAQESGNIGLIDWHKTTEGHSEYLIDDGIHLTELGRSAYSQLIRQALCGR